MDAAKRLGLHGALGHELRTATRQAIRAKIDGYLASNPEKMASLLELREVVGDRASDAERARRYRERKDPERASHRRAHCDTCGTPLIGRRLNTLTCSPLCRVQRNRRIKQAAALANGPSPELKARIKRAKRLMRKGAPARLPPQAAGHDIL